VTTGIHKKSGNFPVFKRTRTLYENVRSSKDSKKKPIFQALSRKKKHGISSPWGQYYDNHVRRFLANFLLKKHSIFLKKNVVIIHVYEKRWRRGVVVFVSAIGTEERGFESL
jgi:hypothetical protein